MRRIYEAALATADPEWKALLGRAGSEGNLASNASLDITRPFAAISEAHSGLHAPLMNNQPSAVASENTNGSPSNTPNLRGVDKSASTENIGVPGAPASSMSRSTPTPWNSSAGSATARSSILTAPKGRQWRQASSRAGPGLPAAGLDLPDIAFGA
jgi:hypothetical protein